MNEANWKWRKWHHFPFECVPSSFAAYHKVLRKCDGPLLSWLKSSRQAALNLLFEFNLLNQFGWANIDLGTFSTVHMFYGANERERYTKHMDVLERSSFQPTPICFFLINLTWARGLCVRTSKKNWEDSSIFKWTNHLNAHDEFPRIISMRNWTMTHSSTFSCVCTLKWRNNGVVKKISRFWILTSNEPHVTLPFSLPLIWTSIPILKILRWDFEYSFYLIDFDQLIHFLAWHGSE